MKKKTLKNYTNHTEFIELSTFLLTDIVDLDILQQLQDSFAQTFNMPSIIYGPEGTPITKPSCFTPFCTLVRSTKKGAKRCENFDAELIRSLYENPIPTIRYGCALNNMVTGTVPIMIQGHHFANWGIGQLVDKDIDLEEITNYATTIGVERTDLISAAQTLVLVDKEQFERTLSFLETLSKQISILGFKNMAQSAEIAKRKRAENLLQQKTDNLQIAIEKLKIIEQDIKNKNIALKVLLDQKQDTRNELEEQMAALLKKLVYPYLEMLQQDITDTQQKEYLALIKAHLDAINGTFTPKSNNSIWNLTPREILVADLIQKGKSTAEITQLLKISNRTTEKFRYNIRKKIGLTKKRIRLYEYLNRSS